jgi:hypothetical protein
MEIITKKKDLSTAPIYRSLSTFSISECINVGKACLKFHTSAPWYHKCIWSQMQNIFFLWMILAWKHPEETKVVSFISGTPWFPSFHVQLQWSKSIISAKNYIHVGYFCLELNYSPKKRQKRFVCRKMVY